MVSQKHLEKALKLMLYWHRSQKDKAGEPYILHPVRVMLTVDSIEEKIVALLHDVAEDSGRDQDVVLREILHEFGVDIADAVRLLTRDKKIPYKEYLTLIKKNPLALKVKITDILDNKNLERLSKLPQKESDRLLHKYVEALKILKP